MTVRAALAGAPRGLPAAAAAGLRLQLSVQPQPGGNRRFRLGLRPPEGAAGEPLAEFDLQRVSYRVRSARCHELTPGGAAAEPLLLTFPEEREAQRWWTILSSSLREAQRGSEGSLPPQAPAPQALPPQAPAVPAAAGAAAAEDPEEARCQELARNEDLALRLAQAIEFGDAEAASRCAVALARQHATLSILFRESNYPGDEISMKVGVEDATSSASITLRVRAHTTIAALKQQVFQDYGFHPLVQRWIIGQCLCRDERSLGSYGIRRHGDAAFLYLLSARLAELSEQRYEEDQARMMLSCTSSSSSPSSSSPSSSLHHDTADAGRRYSTMPSAAAKRGWSPTPPRRPDVEGMSHHLDTLQLGDPSAHPPPSTPSLPSPTPPGWSCPTCTFINKPTRPGCEMCSAARPDDYVVPGGHQPDETERWRMRQEQEGIRQYQQALEAERQQNLQQLLATEEELLVPNREELECSICCQSVPQGQGVLLRDCLHSFCRECLRQVITFSEEPEVSCPYRDDTYACDSRLQPREIRALLSPEEYGRFLERSPALAERRSRDSFHCRSPDCRGWCLCEDSLSQFRCPVCGATNCLRCKAIHEGQSCREYQEELQLRALNDSAAQQTSDMLQALVRRGEAMRCPTCRIVLQKKDGCDWLRCSVCQTEICWVTKGPRWGPAGPGDTSGGCRCNVNGQKCHPRCQNCH